MIYRLCKRISVLFCAAALIAAGTVIVFAGTRLGDADSDGVITIIDATGIQKFLAGLPSPLDP